MSTEKVKYERYDDIPAEEIIAAMSKSVMLRDDSDWLSDDEKASLIEAEKRAKETGLKEKSGMQSFATIMAAEVRIRLRRDMQSKGYCLDEEDGSNEKKRKKSPQERFDNPWSES